MVLMMSHKELTRLDTLRRVESGDLIVDDAALLLGLSRRQLFRLLARLRSDGPHALVSRKRGRPSNRCLGAHVRSEAIRLVRERYADFGPTFAAEMLAERHDLHLSKETLRQLMIADGLWLTRKAHRARIHQPRYRRDCVGELVQIDGSQHRWFEDRGPQATLLVYVDDATSRLMHLKFVPSESTMAYLQATRAYIEQHGKPIAFYSDKHGVFRVNRVEPEHGDGMTQFGRALHALNIDIICANSPAAKGRVERVHGTLQDRLVKELRMEGISDVDAANAWLPGFIGRYNDKFARPPACDKNLHRSLAAHEDLERTLAWREQRTLSAALTLHYNKTMFIVDPGDFARTLVRRRIDVIDKPDGSIELQYEGTPLAYRVFDKLRRVNQAPVVDNKHLGAALAMAKQLQAERPHHASRNQVPQRSAQASHMFPDPAPAEAPIKVDRRRLGNQRLKKIARLSQAELAARGTAQFALPACPTPLPGSPA